MGKRGTGHLYKKRGSGCWRVRWMVDGKIHDETTGTTELDKARKIASQKTACSNALGDVRALTARLEKAKNEQTILEARSNPSLNLFKMIDAFISLDITRRKHNSSSTIRTWYAHGNILIDEFGGNTELRQITREQAEECMRKYEQTVSSVRFNATLSFFKRVWEALSNYDSPTELKARLGESPWKMIMPVQSNERQGKKPFTPEQLTSIWRVLEEINNPELTMLFDLARNTGARLHDLVTWKWDEHITFNSREELLGTKRVINEVVFEWKPNKTKNSSGKLMVIPVSDQRVVSNLYNKWKSRKVGEEYILPEMLELYNRYAGGCGLTKLCQSVFKRAGLKTQKKVDGFSRANCVYGMHSFRHTLVSELFKKGVDLGTIQHLYTGHHSSFITELYAHADLDKKRIDLSKLAHIEVEQKKPDGFQTFIGQMNEDDQVEYDHIKLMPVSKQMQNELISLLKFKNREELVTIKEWIERRLKGI